MFALPQPEPAEMETMDGLPVIRLQDKAQDVEVFLKAIFDSRSAFCFERTHIQLPPSFFMPPPAEFQLGEALAILRLSHKYDVPYLRRRALDHVGPIYPTSLAGYGDNNNRRQTSSSTH
ncbi:hypothetical protein K438DRAFT_1798203 [Mycena galopus ATCC 62051]|nr:hypothetical protein K438DRAFT_1798203 [Mycena galopus ATCC 62051]